MNLGVRGSFQPPQGSRRVGSDHPTASLGYAAEHLRCTELGYADGVVQHSPGLRMLPGAKLPVGPLRASG